MAKAAPKPGRRRYPTGCLGMEHEGGVVQVSLGELTMVYGRYYMIQHELMDIHGRYCMI